MIIVRQKVGKEVNIDEAHEAHQPRESATIGLQPGGGLALYRQLRVAVGELYELFHGVSDEGCLAQ